MPSGPVCETTWIRTVFGFVSSDRYAVGASVVAGTGVRAGAALCSFVPPSLNTSSRDVEVPPFEEVGVPPTLTARYCVPSAV